MREEYIFINNKSRGNFFPFPHILEESKKEIWIACESSTTAIGINSFLKKFYPEYNSCLCNKATFMQLKAKCK